MAVVIGQNIAAMNAQRRLGEAAAVEARSLNRLSSGLRITRAGDDAAGLAISSALDVDARVYSKAIANANDAISALNIAEGALSELSSIVFRQTELAEQASNGVYSNRQREALDVEANALVSEFNRIVSITSFNGRNLLDGTFQDVNIQVGYGRLESLSVSIGNNLAREVGDGTFQSAQITAVGATPDRLIAADVNNDGALDMIVGNSGFQVILGNGNGTFKALVGYGGISGDDFEVGDVNGDGNLDVVGLYGASIVALLGNGNGTFKAGTSFHAAGTMTGIGSGDFNGDGRLDILGGIFNSDIVMFAGNGNGTFKAPTVAGPSSIWFDIDTADLNNDGFLDIIAGRDGGTGGNGPVTVLGIGNGSFEGGRAEVTGQEPRRTDVADVNGDGILDLMVMTAPTVVNVLIGNGNGTFKAKVTNTSAASVHDLKHGDVNGDGVVDLIVGTYNSGVLVYIGNGNGSFKSAVDYSDGTGPRHVEVGDFDGDGVLDIASANYSGHVGLLLGNSTSVVTMEALNLTTQVDARESLTTAKSYIDRIARELGNIGAIQSRIGVAVQNLSVTVENESAASSSIKDVDVATEAATLAAIQIRKQAAAQVLAQANQLPALALRLLGG